MAESLTTPAILPQTIAENGDANVIPATNDQTEGKASIAYGFPPLTSTPIADGGKMVRRADFNGLFNLLSQYALFSQNGGSFTFDANVSAAIGGYPLGARLVYTDSDGKSHIVKSLIPNNTYNFNSDPTYIDGLKWGYTFVDFDANNVFTKKQIINLTDTSDINFLEAIYNDVATNNTIPASDKVRRIQFLADNGDTIGSLFSRVSSSGETRTDIYARRTIGGNDVTAVISASVDSNGKIITYAHTPSDTSNSTEIATTAWVSILLKGAFGSPYAYNGWSYLGNSTGIVWGHVTNISTNETEVTLTHAFDGGASYAVVAAHSAIGDGSPNATMRYYYLYGQTSTSFKVKANTSSNGALSYIAIGKMTLSNKP